MGVNAIMQWLSGHFGMRERRDYFDGYNKTVHRVEWDNGDTYKHTETFTDSNHKTVTTEINGTIVYSASLEWIPFQWKEI